MGSFAARMAELSAKVGDGDLVGSVTFSGPAAVPQHEHPSRFSPPSWKNRPVLDYTVPGTGIRYLIAPLLENYPRYLQDIANELLDANRGPANAMAESMDDLSGKAARRAPRDKGDLAGSATSLVTDRGALVHRRGR